jgi:hypothetical protein
VFGRKLPVGVRDCLGRQLGPLESGKKERSPPEDPKSPGVLTCWLTTTGGVEGLSTRGSSFEGHGSRGRAVRGLAEPPGPPTERGGRRAPPATLSTPAEVRPPFRAGSAPSLGPLLPFPTATPPIDPLPLPTAYKQIPLTPGYTTHARPHLFLSFGP